MAKKVSRYRRYYSTGTPDEKERSLLPGTPEYKKRQTERLGKAFGVNSFIENDKQRDISDESDKEETAKVAVNIDSDPSDDEQMSLDIDMAHDVAVRKFRRKRSKERKIDEVRDIAKGALNKDIPVHNTFNIPGRRSMDEELHNDSVDEKSFVGECLRDYESDLKELYDSDNNRDGQTDDDDITPGMRRMMKYM